MPRGAFISYSSKDREFARRLTQDLIEHEIPIWFAEFDLDRVTPLSKRRH